MRTPLVGPFPTVGLWTAVGLPRGAFLAILAIAVACFVGIGGPVWRHPHGDHFARIALSYAVIVPLVAFAFRRRRPFPFGQATAAVAMIALVKLVVTAVLLALIAMASR
jgi:hypothetical protein